MINISEKILVGIHSASAGKLPVSTIAPIGNTAGQKKKLDNIRANTPTQQEFDNIPLPGFTLTNAGRRGWHSGETIWTVIDPRGFTSVITSDNLQHILHCTGITEGLIQEKCVWARHNDQVSMTLIPISSDMYTTAVENTTALANKVSLKAVNLGDIVSLQNGISGTYLGTVVLYSSALIGYGPPDIKPGYVWRRQIIQVTPTLYYYQADLKVLSVVEKCDVPLTKDEVLQQLNTSLSSKHIFTSSEYITSHPSHATRNCISYICHTNARPDEVTYSVEEVTLADAYTLFDLGTDRPDMSVLMLENTAGNHYIVNYTRLHYSSPWWTASQFETIQVDSMFSNMSLRLHSSVYKAKPSGYRSVGHNHKYDNTRYALTDFTKFYKIIKHVKTISYI